MTFKKLICICLLFFLVGCAPPRYPHQFKTGDMVRVKIDGSIGMVINTYTYYDLLDVRVSALSGDSPLLGGTITTNVYSLETFHEYELEGVSL